MLRSFDYVGASALRDNRVRPGDVAVLKPWTDAWVAWVSASYLAGYLETIARAQATAEARTDETAPFVPANDADTVLLLDFYMLEKCIYEVSYELNNRPDWLDIPLRSPPAISGRSPIGSATRLLPCAGCRSAKRSCGRRAREERDLYASRIFDLARARQLVGELRIVIPAGATCAIDGEQVAVERDKPIPVDAGRHAVVATLNGAAVRVEAAGTLGFALFTHPRAEITASTTGMTLRGVW
ncbi:hypothetical protein WMF39_35415 [Sorangium sp. So ce1504]|uniref:hypothetical protein n=1 Tax=Sorangium sp. So ce1504 TaxID=3133337 RepID=UPI003F62791F